MILAVKIEYVLILALATLVFIVLSAILAFLLWRKKNSIGKLRKEFEEQGFNMGGANLGLLEKNEMLEEQKQKLAEANMKLFEQQEKLEEQSFKLADANLKMLEQNEIIERERQRSEKLLLNILPMRIAEELKENGKTIPESFKDVTVFFSDIVGFTKMSSEMGAAEVISELNEIFTAFDRIITRNGCERIKTIGDAYLCVCGMPVPNKDHALNIAKSAFEIIEYLKGKNAVSQLKWEIRAGIHSGPVVGGVVGTEKYIYDVFGDTINTASRMESNSEPMKINVSENSYSLLKDKYIFTERPPLDVKGKGLMKMYFLQRFGSLECQMKKC